MRALPANPVLGVRQSVAPEAAVTATNGRTGLFDLDAVYGLLGKPNGRQRIGLHDDLPRLVGANEIEAVVARLHNGAAFFTAMVRRVRDASACPTAPSPCRWSSRRPASASATASFARAL